MNIIDGKQLRNDDMDDSSQSSLLLTGMAKQSEPMKDGPVDDADLLTGNTKTGTLLEIQSKKDASNSYLSNAVLSNAGLIKLIVRGIHSIFIKHSSESKEKRISSDLFCCLLNQQLTSIQQENSQRYSMPCTLKVKYSWPSPVNHSRLFEQQDTLFDDADSTIAVALSQLLPLLPQKVLMQRVMRRRMTATFHRICCYLIMLAIPITTIRRRIK